MFYPPAFSPVSTATAPPPPPPALPPVQTGAALAAARPDITRTAERLLAIPGRPLSAFEAPPDECAFTTRCSYTSDVCHSAVPPLAQLDTGASRCFRAEELRGRLGTVTRS